MADDPNLSGDPPAEPTAHDAWTAHGHSIITDALARARGPRPETIVEVVVRALWSHLAAGPDAYAEHQAVLKDAADKAQAEADALAEKRAAEDEARRETLRREAEPNPGPRATDPDYVPAPDRIVGRAGPDTNPRPAP